MRILNHDIIVKHHILPSSRQKNNKVVELEQTFHDAWHLVFSNMKVDECKTFMDIVMRSDGNMWTKKKLYLLRKDVIKGKVGKYETVTKPKHSSESTGCVLQEEDVHEEVEEE